MTTIIYTTQSLWLNYLDSAEPSEFLGNLTATFLFLFRFHLTYTAISWESQGAPLAVIAILLLPIVLK